ncbi:MAG: glycosyl hydrolase family 76 [Dysgonamonadaceae bacterium]|jgi:predicted alpha-1,6-mannanase (GH76 family)|nr:glycosyl hydrolase family 76 [Dysgonamonadaceae bacterium]
MKKLGIVPLCFLACSFVACSEDKNLPPEVNETLTINWDEAADSCSRALVNWFWDGTEHYFWTDNHGNKNFQYWPQAHALDVLIDAYERSGNNFYKTYFDTWFNGVRAKNGNRWYNSYFDDMEWIALALLRAYNIDHQTKYKDAALELWSHIQEGWNDYAGGGIAWERNNNIWSKNACSNGPACILAARLYRETGIETYKEWALKIYEWEKNVLFNPSTGAVYDNIDGRSGNKNTSWIFTYNQGTFIGSAVELHKITGEKTYLNDAVLAADYTTTNLVNDAILKDEGNGDGGLFKGIFIRYFTELIRQERLDAATQKRYIRFLQHNAETLWTKGANKESVLFGTNWRNRPGSETGLTEQLSGCMLIEAAAKLF